MAHATKRPFPTRSHVVATWFEPEARGNGYWLIRETEPIPTIDAAAAFVVDLDEPFRVLRIDLQTPGMTSDVTHEALAKIGGESIRAGLVPADWLADMLDAARVGYWTAEDAAGEARASAAYHRQTRLTPAQVL